MTWEALPALETVVSRQGIGVLLAEAVYPASAEWAPQMAVRLLMEGFLALITIGTMLIR